MEGHQVNPEDEASIEPRAPGCLAEDDVRAVGAFPKLRGGAIRVLDVAANGSALKLLLKHVGAEAVDDARVVGAVQLRRGSVVGFPTRQGLQVHTWRRGALFSLPRMPPRPLAGSLGVHLGPVALGGLPLARRPALHGPMCSKRSRLHREGSPVGEPTGPCM